jgi:hypothetical protein
MDGVCSTHGNVRNAFRMLFGKSERKRSLERPRRRWDINLKIDLKEILRKRVDWVDTTEEICRDGFLLT